MIVAVFFSLGLALIEPQTVTDDVAVHWSAPQQCGANSLFAYAQLCGFSTTREQVSAALQLPKDNLASVQDLIDGGNRIGLKLECRKVNKNELFSMTTPFIMHVDFTDQGGRGHFVTVTRYEVDELGTVVTFIDGTSCLSTRVDWNKLEESFLGYVIGAHEQFSPSRSFWPYIAFFLGTVVGFLFVWRRT